MILEVTTKQWHVDLRPAETSEQLSFDLAYTLPRRIAAGRTLIIADNTKVFASVIRKRWMKLLMEVKGQRSSTFDRARRTALGAEIERMERCRFATKPPADIPNAQVYILSPGDVYTSTPPCMTLYAAIPVSLSILREAASTLQPGGLIVLYHWQPAYEAFFTQLPEK